ncbi:MAG: SDR family NAD(P)-dependent oxidoreductase, partial [Candidatus Sericytochromatia bacterium]|nr:SDR family NAD(P)-dependent oxidoreductase [Candidatus Sericytochromatia bacterium]
LPPPSLPTLQGLLTPSATLRGKTALVTGGSRGLGALLVQLLALQGCNVYACYHQSREAAEGVRQTIADAGGQVVLVSGDIGDVGHCHTLAERIARVAGGLGILICNAAPALQPSWLDPADAARILAYVTTSVQQVVSPMTACLALLSKNNGACAVISSTYVLQPPPHWPHYVAAKMAIEGLVRVAAVQYPDVGFMVPRPPKMVTDLTNTPLGRVGARAVGPVAAQIVRQIVAGIPKGTVTTLDAFDAETVS